MDSRFVCNFVSYVNEDKEVSQVFKFDKDDVVIVMCSNCSEVGRNAQKCESCGFIFPWLPEGTLMKANGDVYDLAEYPYASKHKEKATYSNKKHFRPHKKRFIFQSGGKRRGVLEKTHLEKAHKRQSRNEGRMVRVKLTLKKTIVSGKKSLLFAVNKIDDNKSNEVTEITDKNCQLSNINDDKKVSSFTPKFMQEQQKKNINDDKKVSTVTPKFMQEQQKKNINNDKKVSTVTPKFIQEQQKKRDGPLFRPPPHIQRPVISSICKENPLNESVMTKSNVTSRTSTALSCEIIEKKDSPFPMRTGNVTPSNIIQNIQLPEPLSYPSIGKKNLKCLDERGDLNDIVIEFYLRYIYNEKLNPELQNKTYLFNSFLYPRLLKELSDTGTKKNPVEDSVKGVDLFSKDFILIPVHKKYNVSDKGHWYLIIICYLSELRKIPVHDEKSETQVCNTETQSAFQQKQSPRKLADEGSCINILDSLDNSKELSKQKGGVAKNCKKPCICFFDSLDSSKELSTEKEAVAKKLKKLANPI